VSRVEGQFRVGFRRIQLFPRLLTAHLSLVTSY
jgi:hypothetical protein